MHAKKVWEIWMGQKNFLQPTAAGSKHFTPLTDTPPSAAAAQSAHTDTVLTAGQQEDILT